ncbi:XRE family transcriptional regulator [Desulfocurvibacter africanus]|nr:XRE family transcriptional regulator [Desulfocurvibacter africanus]
MSNNEGSEYGSDIANRTRNPEGFAERLRKLRMSREMTQQDLSQKLGVSLSTVQNFEKGQFPKGEQLIGLAEVLETSADWLLLGREEPGHRYERPMEVPDVTCLPGYEYVKKVRARLSAGSGSLLTSATIEGYYAFRSDWLRRRGNPKSMVLMAVTGDSMSPEIMDEDTVLIDEGQKDIYVGKKYAIALDEEVYIKYIDKVPGKYILRSINPLYKPIEVDLFDNSKSVRLIGRMIWLGRVER